MQKYITALASAVLLTLALSLGCGKENDKLTKRVEIGPYTADRIVYNEPVLTIDGKPDLLWEGKTETDLIKRSVYFTPVGWPVDRECTNRLTEEYNGNLFFVRASPALDGDELKGFFVYATRTFAGYSGMENDINDIGFRCRN